MRDIERQIRSQTEAGYERLGPVEDLLPPEMAEAFGVEPTPVGTTTLSRHPVRRATRAWVVAAVAFTVVMLIGIPTMVQLNQSEPEVAAPPTVAPTQTTLEQPRPEMIQNPDNGHFYEPIVSDVALDWSDARSDAESLEFRGVSGHLVTITSPSEDQFLTEAFPQLLNSGPWLGGFQPEGSDEPRGGWQWVTGESFDYTNWIDGEPNNDGPDEACLQYLPEPPGWNDFPCGAGPGTAYIVEYDTPSS